jgi:hypothetical protein
MTIIRSVFANCKKADIHIFTKSKGEAHEPCVLSLAKMCLLGDQEMRYIWFGRLQPNSLFPQTNVVVRLLVGS